MLSHVEKLQQKLRETGAEAALLTSPINQRYVTGFPFDDGYVAVTRNAAYLVTDFRYKEAAALAVDPARITVATPSEGLLRYISDRFCEEGVKSYLFEEATLPVAEYERIIKGLNGVTCEKGLSALVDNLRLFKDEKEIESMQRAQDIADGAFAHILKTLSFGMTETDVAAELEFFMKKNGAEDTSFDTIAVSGEKSSRPHGVPSPVRLSRGFLTIDFGCKVDGYCSDMTRTVVMGKVTADEKRLYDTVYKAQTTAVAAAREGIGCRELDKIARDIIENAGYRGCFGHSLGHGVGLYIHEAPTVSPRAKEEVKLLRGNTFTVEPGIYVEGRYGCRIEDCMCIQPDGTVRNFAHSPKGLIEI